MYFGLRKYNFSKFMQFNISFIYNLNCYDIIPCHIFCKLKLDRIFYLKNSYVLELNVDGTPGKSEKRKYIKTV